jgi:hypothetical protein
MPFIKKAELETLRTEHAVLTEKVYQLQTELDIMSTLWSSVVINPSEKLPRVRREMFLNALKTFAMNMEKFHYENNVFADFNHDSLAYEGEFDSNVVLQHMYAVHPMRTLNFVRLNINVPGRCWDLFTLRNYCNTFLKS